MNVNIATHIHLNSHSYWEVRQIQINLRSITEKKKSLLLVEANGLLSKAHAYVESKKNMEKDTILLQSSVQAIISYRG